MFTLQTSGGTTVATGTGSASTYPGWQTYLFPAPITLKNGQAYNLVISGSVYRAVQKGNNYGMYTAFPDGRYTGNIAYDLQFYFTLSQAAVQIPAPTGLSIVSSTTSQVTLGWTQPAGFTPAGYKIYCGASSGSYTQSTDAGNVTQYTLTGLSGPLYFAVTDYDVSKNESGYSNEVLWTPKAACTYTISPTNKSFPAAGGSGTVSVTASGSSCSWGYRGRRRGSRSRRGTRAQAAGP